MTALIDTRTCLVLAKDAIGDAERAAGRGDRFTLLIAIDDAIRHLNDARGRKTEPTAAEMNEDDLHGWRHMREYA